MSSLRPVRDPSGLTVYAETDVPTHCAARHPLGPGAVVVGWQPCACTDRRGHRTYTCRACGDVVYVPPCTDPTRHVRAG